VTREERLKLIARLGRRRAEMADSWQKLAVEVAIAALYSDELGDDTWIAKRGPIPRLPKRRCFIRATLSR
jgi:hypothetical protein